MPKREINMGRLTNAIQRARLALRYFRTERREAVRQYVGLHWSEEGADKMVPVNLLALYLSIVARNLIAKNPRVMLSTFEREAKPVVHAMEDWANKEIKVMRFANTMQRVVVDALWCIGICKVALASPADGAHVSWRLAAGQPFAERVDLDDFVFDTHARDFSEVQFIGHRIRRPFDMIAESKLYTAARKDLTPSYDSPYNIEGDERISMIGRTYYEANSEEFEPMIDLWEIYLPRHKVVVTIADEEMSGQGSAKPLREQEWIGPDTGPYHMLGFGTVPGNAMPKGPLQDLLDLHNTANNIYRKLDRQAERQKSNTFVRGGATEDAQRVLEGNDGEMLRVDDPTNITQIDQGGPNQNNFAFGQHIIDQFMKFAGNLEMMGGLAPQSKTLGQDEMLQKNAHGGVADMQDRTVDYTAEVLESLLWYWHRHPQKVMQSQFKVAEGISINRRVTPEQRQKVQAPDIEIDPYSMQHSTPQQRLAGLQQFVTQVYMPGATLFAQQGVTIDLQTFAEKYGRYMDMPDLADIITIQEPVQPDQAGAGQAGPTKPPETTRNYVRRSLGGDTGEARNAAITNQTPGTNGKQPAGAA